MSTQFEQFGKYILLEKLATGGMAEVFLARGTGVGGIGKFFAIKRILPQYADSPEFIEMFKDEAKIAINLNHSNIVSIHEFGVEKGQFFLVMDYVEGRNLRQILNKMKKSNLQFSIDQIVYVIKEVGAGLDHAHRCIDGSTGKPLNITHRDMSPQNLMVSFEGEVKVVDFGIAKAESQIETTRAGTLKGKFGYMSPEQAEGLPVDLRTDIFSLGIVMWELLANDRLFVANNEINTLRKIRDCQIPSLRKVNPNIHSELERIVHKALARDRNLRYQTGAALNRDLNRFLNRQYPDFSPQDFAVFIKSVFSDEILSLRKRLVDYSKMNVDNNANSNDRNFDDRTSLLDTNTNSLVVSDNSSSFAQPNDSFDAATKTRDSISSSTGSASLSIASNTQTDAHKLPPTPQSEKSGPVLDEMAIAAEMQREIQVKGKATTSTIETEDLTMTGRGRISSSSYTPRARSLPPQVMQPKVAPMRMATFMVFALLCVSVYSYLVKYFTPMMADVIVVTDPYLHELHASLGVTPHTTNVSSQAPSQMPIAAEQQQAQPAAPPVREVQSNEDVSQGLIVISNPSGAEIFLNNKSTGMVTPSRVEVPKVPFEIMIRKKGYVDSKMTDVTKEKLGHRLVANLVKMNVAYVDIDVFPPQDAIIYINDKPLPLQKGPIHELAVTANTSIRIRAETKNRTAYDEVTITLPVDKRQSVMLNPHNPMRIPSNAPNQ